MIIGDRLRELRERKGLSQGDIEKRTGLARAYISRVENGHTVPSIDTLESLRVRSKSRCTSFFTTVSIRPSYQTCESGRRSETSYGAVRERTPEF